MATFGTFNFTSCFTWLSEKCKSSKIETTSLYPTVAIEVRPNIQQQDRIYVPTIFADVQELTFDRDGRPSLITVKPSGSPILETNSNESQPETIRWAYSLPTQTQVEDLQQIDVERITDQPRINIHTRIDSEASEDLFLWKPSSHLHKYFRMMHICGTAPLPTSTLSGHSSWKGKIFTKLERAFFWITVACAVFDLAGRAKYWLLCFLSGDGFNAFVKFACHMISAGTAIYYALLLYRSKDITKMSKILDTFESQDKYEEWKPYLAPVCALVSVITSFSYQIFGFGMWDESFIEVILLSSHSLSQDLFLWDWNNQTSSNQQLYEQYSEETITNIVLGSFLIFRDFISELYMGMMWDLVLIVNFVLSSWKYVFLTKHAINVLENVESPESLAERMLQRTRELVFHKWRAYREVYKNVNVVFGPFLPLFHVRNILMYAFFLGICVLPDEKTTTVVYVNYFYNIVKAEVTYAVSSRLTQQDETMRKMLRNWGMHSGKITVGDKYWDLTALLDELDSEPMVFGTGNFAINQRFHFGIIGLVGSLFISLANGIGKVSTGT